MSRGVGDATYCATKERSPALKGKALEPATEAGPRACGDAREGQGSAAPLVLQPGAVSSRVCKHPRTTSHDSTVHGSLSSQLTGSRTHPTMRSQKSTVHALPSPQPRVM